MMWAREASVKILVVCGAGASSTFVAQRLNSAAEARDLPYAATATNELFLEEGLELHDLVLVGPHLAPHLARIRDLAAPHGVGVVLMDGDVFSDLDGSRTLARIEAAIHDGTAWPASAVTS